jgi:hypothetical protein
MSTSQIVYVSIASFIAIAIAIGFIQSEFMYICSRCKISKFKWQMYEIKAIHGPPGEDPIFKCTCNKCAKAIDKKLKASLEKGRR